MDEDRQQKTDDDDNGYEVMAIAHMAFKPAELKLFI